MATYSTLSITRTNILTNNASESVIVTLTPLTPYFDTAPATSSALSRWPFPSSGETRVPRS